MSLFSSCAAFISNVGLQKPNAIVFNPCHPSPRYLDATTVFRAIYPDVFERTKKTNIQNSFGTMKEAMQHGAALAHCGEHEILYLMCLSRRLNVEFQLRPSNPNGLHFFELGFHPKPSTIKQKTVNKEDIILYNFEKKSLKQLYQQFDIRVPSDNKYFSPLGLVACFQPDEQRYHTALNGTALNDIQKQKLTKRFKQRQQEYEACVEKLQKQEKAGKLIWYNNTFIVMKYPEQGYHRKFRNAWVPVCGDRDFFSMKCFSTGFELLPADVCEKRYLRGEVSEEQYKLRHDLDALLNKTWELLKNSVLMPQHGQHCAWEYEPPKSFEASINEVIMKSHSLSSSSEVECLLKITPNLEVTSFYLNC